MAVKYTDEELTKVGQKALRNVPYSIRRGLGDIGSIEFKQKPAGGKSIAEVSPGRRIIYIDKPNEFVQNPQQLTSHEATHILQSRLHPTVQAKFPATDEANPYGQMNSDNADVVLQSARQKGKTISDFSREEQGAIVQRYSAYTQGLNDAIQNHTLTPDLKNRYQKVIGVYQPYLDDYNKLPLSIVEPTDPDQKNINTKPTAPPGPDPSLLHADVVMPTVPPERTPVPDPNLPDQGNSVSFAPPQTQQQDAPQTGVVPQQTPPQNPNVSVQQTPQQPTAAQANVAHSAMLGSGFKALLGSHTTYQQTPNGPVPVQKQNSVTDMFRNILAGAIAGGAASGSQNTTGSGWRSAAIGAGAAQNQAQQSAQQAQQQAQQQFGNSLTAQKAQQEATAAASEEQIRKANIALSNAQTLRTNQLTQGESFDTHQKMADADKNRIASYEISGLKPVTETPLSESEMADYLKNRPGSSTLDWRHAGVKTVIGPDGNPSYESTFMAYDPRGPITVAPATVKQWKEDGLFDYYPEAKDMIDKKQTLDFNTFNRLDDMAQGYNNQKLLKEKQSQDTQLGQAKINETLAATAHDWAATRHENAATGEIGEAKNKANMQSKALAEYSKSGGDLSKVSPGNQLVLRQYADEQAKDTLSAIKSNSQAAEMGDPDAKAREQELWGQYHQLSQLGSLTSKAATQNQGPEGPTSPYTSNGKVYNLPQSAVAGFLKDHPDATYAGKTVPVSLAGATIQVPATTLSDFLTKNPQAEVKPPSDIGAGIAGPLGTNSLR